jgi:hypothetical protein
MFFKKEKPSISLTQEIIIGSVSQPTKDEVDYFRDNKKYKDILMKIIDYRISNAYRQFETEDISDTNLRSINGEIR